MPAGGDPVVDLLLEHGKRERARIEHLVVEPADVELVAQRLLGLVTQALDGEGTDLVSQRLARDGNVAFDLGGGVGPAHPTVGEHVLDRFVAAPALGVHAGVDHQPHRAQHLVVERAEALVGIVIEPHRIAVSA